MKRRTRSPHPPRHPPPAFLKAQKPSLARVKGSVGCDASKREADISEDELEWSGDDTTASSSNSHAASSVIKDALSKHDLLLSLDNCCMCGVSSKDEPLTNLVVDAYSIEAPRVNFGGKTMGQYAYCESCKDIPTVHFALANGLIEKSHVRKSMKFLLAKSTVNW